MKKNTIFIILLVFTLGMLSACTSPADPKDDTNTSASSGLTEFISTDIFGEAIDQTVFENHKLTMVNIWAGFCGPCIAEMPDLAKLNEDYADQGFQVVGIVADAQENNPEQLETTLAIVEQTGAEYTHILTSESLYEAKLRSVQYVPETVFVDAKGNQVGEAFVGSKSYEGWSEIIEQLLSEVE